MQHATNFTGTVFKKSPDNNQLVIQFNEPSTLGTDANIPENLCQNVKIGDKVSGEADIETKAGLIDERIVTIKSIEVT